MSTMCVVHSEMLEVLESFCSTVKYTVAKCQQHVGVTNTVCSMYVACTLVITTANHFLHIHLSQRQFEANCSAAASGVRKRPKGGSSRRVGSSSPCLADKTLVPGSCAEIPAAG